MKFAYFRKYAINSSYSSQQRNCVSFCWPRSANYFKANDTTDRGRSYQVYQSRSCIKNGEEISCLVSLFVWCNWRIEFYGKKKRYNSTQGKSMFQLHAATSVLARFRKQAMNHTKLAFLQILLTLKFSCQGRVSQLTNGIR